MADLIFAAVRTKEAKEVFTVLRAHPLEDLDFIAAIDLLGATLKQAMLSKADEKVLKLILARWLVVLEAKDTMDVIGILAGLVSVSPEVLRYVMYTVPNVRIHEILHENLISQKATSGRIFSLAADRLIAAAGMNADMKVWDSLLIAAQSKNRYDAIPYIVQKLAGLRQPAPAPKWATLTKAELKLCPSRLNPHQWTDYKVPTLSAEMVSKTVRLLRETITAKDEDKEDVAPEVLEEMTKIAMATGTGIIDNGKEDPDRLFGPLNAIIERECPTSIPGGCRMLTCCCRDFDQDTDPVLDTSTPYAWFTGNCASDSCQIKLVDVSHALRQPVDGGGWVGCYCSMECIREQPSRELNEVAADLEEEKKKPEREPARVYREVLLKRMIEVIEEKGILDRAALGKPTHSGTKATEAKLPPLPSIDELMGTEGEAEGKTEEAEAEEAEAVPKGRTLELDEDELDDDLFYLEPALPLPMEPAPLYTITEEEKRNLSKGHLPRMPRA
ncbi:Hypothetical protein POVN_LOCUS354 [uncultured virus]|nr:Hypothetical protein POVN_LOCUS354 [uncultured virus]